MPIILDFHILTDSTDSFRLEVFDRNGSQLLAAATIEDPLFLLTDLTEFAISRLDVDSKDPSERYDRLKAFGGKLYRILFTPEVARVWQQYKVRGDFLALCLRIASEADKLEALPWETLYDGREFIAAGAMTSLSRLPHGIPPSSDSQPVPLPIRMLAFVSSPLDLPDHQRLQSEREQEILFEAVNAPAGQGRLHIDFEDEARLEILENSLKSVYHILHFTGHGVAPAAGGGLLLEDAEGKSRRASVGEILQALQKSQSMPRLVVLSGCQTARTLHASGFRDLARELIRAGVPAVVGMQFSISDEAGLLFAEEFYCDLSEGEPIEKALSAARRALCQQGDFQLRADALAPVLLTSNGQCLQTAEVYASTPAAQSGTEQVTDGSGVHPQLPKLKHGFYGRRREYRQVRDGLLHRNHHAVVIHGISGIGKTALITYAAIRLRKNFIGVCAFDCSGGALSPERIILELNRCFESRGIEAMQPLVHQSGLSGKLANDVAQILSQWPLLVIFDNFEDQLERADNGFRIADPDLRAFIAALVEATAGSSGFLFSSRYRFSLGNVERSKIVKVPLGDLSRPEAMGLMLKLSNLANTTYLDKYAVYEKFGGHPAALIELNSYCDSRPLKQVLDNPLLLRHKLRWLLALDADYSKLSARSRDSLNRLAAFREPTPRKALEWVIGEKVLYAAEVLSKFEPGTLPEGWERLDEAERLKAIEDIIPEKRRASDADQVTAELERYGLLVITPDRRKGAIPKLVRDYCRDQQTDETWRDCLLDAAAFYTNLTKLLNPDEKDRQAVEAEMKAFELLIEAGDYENAGGLLAANHDLLDRWGLGFELFGRYKRLLGKVDRAGVGIISHNLSMLLQDRGDYEEAEYYSLKSLAIAEELGDQVGAANSLNQLGVLFSRRGEYKTSVDYFEKALGIREELGDRKGIASLLHNLALIHKERGDLETAATYYGRAFKVFEEVGDDSKMGAVLHSLGSLYESRGNLLGAIMYYEESREIKEKLGDRSGVAVTLHQIGSVYHERGKHEEALAYYRQAFGVFDQLDDDPNLAAVLHSLGLLYQAQDDYETSLEYFQQSLSIEEKIGDRAGVASSQFHIGRVHQWRKEYDQALLCYEQALKTYSETGQRANIARSLHQIGVIYQIRGDHNQAVSQFRQALEIHEKLGNRTGIAVEQGSLGQLLMNLGRYAEAFEMILTAFQSFLNQPSPDVKIEPSPYAKNAAVDLKRLRSEWGEENFDAAWLRATNGDVPDWMK